MSLGEVIKRRRTELGLSQAQLGEKVGRTGSTVRRWERGESAPASEVVADLAAALGLDFDQLRAAAVAPPPPDRTDPGAPRSTPPVPRSTAPVAAPPVRQPAKPVPNPPQPSPAAKPASRERAAPAPTARPAATAPAAPAAVEERPTEMAPIPVATAPTVDVEPPRTPRFALWRRAPQAPGTSYLEDTRQRWRYWMRYALTAVALLIAFIVLVWAVGELTEALGRVWDLFGEAESPDTTGLGTNF